MELSLHKASLVLIFFSVHSNYLTFEYCESIWLTIKHVKFDMEGVGYGLIKPFGPVGNVWEHPTP